MVYHESNFSHCTSLCAPYAVFMFVCVRHLFVNNNDDVNTDSNHSIPSLSVLLLCIFLCLLFTVFLVMIN